MDTFSLLFILLCLMFIIVKLVNRKSKEDKEECDE